MDDFRAARCGTASPLTALRTAVTCPWYPCLAGRSQWGVTSPLSSYQAVTVLKRPRRRRSLSTAGHPKRTWTEVRHDFWFIWVTFSVLFRSANMVKNFSVRHFAHTFQLNSFIPLQVYATFSLLHFIPHLEALALTEGHKVSGKQNLLSSLFCTLILGNNFSGWIKNC